MLCYERWLRLALPFNSITLGWGFCSARLSYLYCTYKVYKQNKQTESIVLYIIDNQTTGAEKRNRMCAVVGRPTMCKQRGHYGCNTRDTNIIIKSHTSNKGSNFPLHKTNHSIESHTCSERERGRSDERERTVQC